MSFSRFAADNSDVYTFPNSDGELECCGCLITDTGRFTATDVNVFLAHLERHSLAGDVVPGHTGRAIRAWVADHPDGWGRPSE